ncbi:conserved domain protein [Streptococcus infantis SK970]|nr:conserved domain protein [Streptococcus infantis SK970]
MFLVKVGQIYRKLENSDDISELVAPEIDPENSREFDPEIKLEHDEWFYVEIDDSHMSMVKEYEDKFLNTAGLNDVNEAEFSKIDLIFRKVENDGLVFQKITQSKRLVDKSILKWRRRKAERTIIENGIELKSENDAYFDGNNKLYFRSFRTIRSLFKGIDDYYRIASLAEVDEFKEFDLVSFVSDFKIKTDNLKMLAILKDDEIDLSNTTIISTLLTSYEQYPEQDFKVSKGKFIIDTNKQLTSFLKLALGRLYTNPITKHKMEASSARRLRKKEN